MFPKIGVHFNWVFHYKPSILRYQYFWKHPYLLLGHFQWVPKKIAKIRGLELVFESWSKKWWLNWHENVIRGICRTKKYRLKKRNSTGMWDVNLHSVKLTFSPLKMDGWNTIVSFWDGLFLGAMLVLGRVVNGLFHPYISRLCTSPK